MQDVEARKVKRKKTRYRVSHIRRSLRRSDFLLQALWNHGSVQNSVVIYNQISVLEKSALDNVLSVWIMY